jgi:hypothetical protein
MLSFYTVSSLSAPALVRIYFVALMMVTNMGTATSYTGYGHHGALRADRAPGGSSATNVATPVKTTLFDKDPQAVAERTTLTITTTQSESQGSVPMFQGETLNASNVLMDTKVSDGANVTSTMVAESLAASSV